MTTLTDKLSSPAFAAVINERKLASKTQRAKTERQVSVARSYTYSRNGLSLISFRDRTVLKTNRAPQPKEFGAKLHKITKVKISC